jgi:hypothetical protein
LNKLSMKNLMNGVAGLASAGSIKWETRKFGPLSTPLLAGGALLVSHASSVPGRAVSIRSHERLLKVTDSIGGVEAPTRR